MNTTGPVTTVTDELLAELESGVYHYHCSIPGDVVAMLTAELRRLRSENAELAKDAGRLEWVVKSKQMRVQGRDDSWFVLDCGNGLTFVTDRKLTYREAIDTAMAAK